MGDIFTIFDKFFLGILMQGIQRFMLLLNLQRCYQKSSHKVCIFCEKTVGLLLKENVQLIFFFDVEDCMTASGNISLFFKERAAASKKILRKTTSSRNF